MAYGYAVSVSPMHVALMYGSIANCGVRIKPRLVDSIISPDGTVYDDCQPREGDNVRIMKPSTARYVLQALHSVTNPDPRSEKGRGTGHTANIPGFKIGGKTGTAEKVVNGSYIDKFHVASFAGIFPLDENINWEAEMAKPKEKRKKVYVVFTVVDGTSGGGGTAAAPIFRRVAERIIRMENIQPTDPAAYAAYLKKQEDEAKTATAH
jgi:cell division protein FtsI/penicillin-binding protein 2